MMQHQPQVNPRFFAYDFTVENARFKWDYDRFFYERWCREAGSAVLAHPDRVTDPEQADFFVVTNSLSFLPFAGVDHESYMAETLLVHRKTGKPHLIFDFSDRPMPVIEDPELLICKSAWHECFYEVDRHVPIPQFPRYRFNQAFEKATKRPFLAGFKGNLRPEWADLRTHLMVLNEDRRMKICSGVFLPRHLFIDEAGEAWEVPDPGDQGYTRLLFDSTFALLPRANGFALSYRMIECMNAGCVPVILSDGYVLPFEDLLDYQSFSLRVNEEDLPQLAEILEDHLDRADELQTRAFSVFEQYFSSTEKIIRHSLDLAASRVAALKAGGQR